MTTAISNPPHRSWPIIVASLMGILLLVGLGSWQVLRLQWKLDLIEKRSSSLTGNPVTIYDIEAGMEHGYDVDRILWLGRQMERTVGQRLRSEAAINGRTLKEGHMKFARPGLEKRKEKMGEKPDQNFPTEWAEEAVLPEAHRP